MARLVIEINLDNSAFEENKNGEISKCLDRVKAGLDAGLLPAMMNPISDTNGTRIGYWKEFKDD